MATEAEQYTQLVEDVLARHRTETGHSPKLCEQDHPLFRCWDCDKEYCPLCDDDMCIVALEHNRSDGGSS